MTGSRRILCSSMVRRTRPVSASASIVIGLSCSSWPAVGARTTYGLTCPLGLCSKAGRPVGGRGSRLGDGGPGGLADPPGGVVGQALRQVEVDGAHDVQGLMPEGDLLHSPQHRASHSSRAVRPTTDPPDLPDQLFPASSRTRRRGSGRATGRHKGIPGSVYRSSTPTPSSKGNSSRGTTTNSAPVRTSARIRAAPGGSS